MKLAFPVDAILEILALARTYSPKRELEPTTSKGKHMLLFEIYTMFNVLMILFSAPKMNVIMH